MNTKAPWFTNFHAWVAVALTLVKQTGVYTHAVHSTRENSEIYAHVNSCEHFQHIKSLLELSPHLSNPTCTNTTQLIFNNCKVIDKSDHWSLLLFKESLAIRRRKPILNHGQSFKRAYYISITPPHLL